MPTTLSVTSTMLLRGLLLQITAANQWRCFFVVVSLDGGHEEELASSVGKLINRLTDAGCDSGSHTWISCSYSRIVCCDCVCCSVYWG